MEIKIHSVDKIKIAELVSTNVLINTIEDGLNLIGDLYYQGFDRIIIYEINMSPLFFDLKSGFAGELLQKFTNYRMQLTIIGDFSNYPSKSFQDFIYESNKGKQIGFLPTLSSAVSK